MWKVNVGVVSPTRVLSDGTEAHRNRNCSNLSHSSSFGRVGIRKSCTYPEHKGLVYAFDIVLCSSGEWHCTWSELFAMCNAIACNIDVTTTPQLDINHFLNCIVCQVYVCVGHIQSGNHWTCEESIIIYVLEHLASPSSLFGLKRKSVADYETLANFSHPFPLSFNFINARSLTMMAFIQC